MSRASNDWDVALADLRDMTGEDVDPSVCVSLGKTSPERIREWARRFELSMRRVLNTAEMWARAELREARRIAK